MPSWSDFEASEPEFASRVRALLTRRKHLTMATLRKEGSPRISGTEMEIADGELRIGSMPGAVKAHDLHRDPRVAIHGPTEDPPEGQPTAWPGEAKVAGRARETRGSDGAHLFTIEIEEAVITHLNEAGNRLVIESWNPVRGYRVVERE